MSNGFINAYTLVEQNMKINGALDVTLFRTYLIVAPAIFRFYFL
jgi:hypothetical protein